MACYRERTISGTKTGLQTENNTNWACKIIEEKREDIRRQDLLDIKRFRNGKLKRRSFMYRMVRKENVLCRKVLGLKTVTEL